MGVTSQHRWPWVFDFADVGGTIPAIPFTATTQRIAPGTVQWVSNAAGAGDQVIISDNEGHELWRSQAASGADFADDYKFPAEVAIGGLVISQLPSGIIYFYFR